MGDSDSSTAQFNEAEAAFNAASEKVYNLRMGAHRLRDRSETLDAEIRERERQVAASPEVQNPPAEGAHNTDTRAVRQFEILTSDGDYVARREEVNALRAGVAQNDAELERARDQRSVAGRRMDFAIAIVGDA